ncbi:MAG: DUF262 domain-containing protein [Ghiorsea sp.]|nr:DUF262 domain-containing protein [Ghiorsea sp.]
MALSLTAEQKTIFEMFSGKDQYVIPPYQRAYSWGQDQCMELFEDLKKAYNENKSEGYFLGNIVLARSRVEKNNLEVVDGQQRLTTLTLLMQVLLYFDDENRDLTDAITIPEGRRGSGKERKRLKTNVFIEKDAKYLEESLSLVFSENRVNSLDNRFKKNIYYFYDVVNEFSQENDVHDFVDFFLSDVSLLPIQTEDEDPDKAREKALKIFETINNRGLPLSDSDIFKARLYAMALNMGKQDDFIAEWKRLDEEAQAIKQSINDIFRVYSQVVRGKEGVKTNEIGLREFFTQSEISPFKTTLYNEILRDLFKVVQTIRFFLTVIEDPGEYNELTKWFQLIHEYTNQYPRNTLLVYLYRNGLVNDGALVDFSKNLVRFSYFQGSAASRIKSHIYDLIVRVTKGTHNEFNFSSDKVSIDDLMYFGMLKKAFSLLVLYLEPNQGAVYPYSFHKIVHPRDAKLLDDSWKGKDFKEYVDTLGNMFVLDFDMLRDTSLDRKRRLLQKSLINGNKEILENLDSWTFEVYQKRQAALQDKLRLFFEKPNED